MKSDIARDQVLEIMAGGKELVDLETELQAVREDGGCRDRQETLLPGSVD